MPSPQSSPFPPRDPSPPGSRLSRRRFLAGLGLMAGAGVLVPLLGRSRRVPLASVEAGRPLMGTWVRVVARHADRDRAARAVERAFEAMQLVDRQMSVHRADSDLNRVNRAAGVEAVKAPPALVEVVARACDGARRSGGVYDPTVLPLMTLFGFYGPERATVPSTPEIDATLARMGWQGVVVDRAAGTLGLARRGMGLDLGSIGKGWAVDRAADALRAEGVRSGLVDAGGNVYGLGVPEDGADGWSVGLFHPVTGRTQRVFVLRDASVATSANTERFRILAGLRIGHLFDAKRGRPADGHLSVSTLAHTGVEADEQSTAAFLLGPGRFRGWPGNLDALYID